MPNYRLPPYLGCSGSQTVFGGCNNSNISRGHVVYSYYNTWSGSASTGTGSVFFDSGSLTNRYELQLDGNGNPVSQSMGACRRLGWKGVLTGKSWHGTFGYFNTDTCTSDTRLACECAYEDDKTNSMTSSVYTTKYRKVEVVGAISLSIGTGSFDVTLSASAEVDRYSSQVTRSFSHTTLSGDPNHSASYAILLNFCNDAVMFRCPKRAEERFPTSCCAFGVGGGNVYNFSCDFAGCSSGESWLLGSHSTTTITDTSFARDGRRIVTSNEEYSFNVSVNFSEPYTSADVNFDADTLLNLWPLNDDVLYPWRTDRQFQITPYIGYHEFHGNIDPRIYLFNSGSTGLEKFTGQIIGLPLPTEIGSPPSASTYGAYYAREHLNYIVEEDEFGACFLNPDEDEPSGSSVPSMGGVGAREYTPDYIARASRGSPVPNDCAPLVPSDILYKGAFKLYGDTAAQYAGNRFWARSWAEAMLFTRPSANWARPCSGSLWHDHLQRGLNQDCEAGAFQDSAYFISESATIPSCSFSGSYANPCGDLRWAGLTANCATESWYNDTRRKFEFVKLNWKYNMRDYGENVRLQAQSASNDECMAYWDANPAGEQSELCGCGISACPPSEEFCEEVLFFGVPGEMDLCIGGHGSDIVTDPYGPCCDWIDYINSGSQCWGTPSERDCTYYDCCCGKDATGSTITAPYGNSKGPFVSQESYCFYESDFTLPAPDDLRPVTNVWSEVHSNDDFMEYQPCKINAVYFVPQGYTHFDKHNVRGYSMSALVIDERYGSKEVWGVEQIMTDPFWKAPPRPCGSSSFEGDYLLSEEEVEENPTLTLSDYTWEEDVGKDYGEDVCGDLEPLETGHTDWAEVDCLDPISINRVHRYYPLRPFVEARTSPPSQSCGAPGNASPLPASARRCVDCENTITHLNDGGFNTEDSASVSNWQCNPPFLCWFDSTTVVPNVYFPWELQSKQESSVLQDKRFSELYVHNGVSVFIVNPF